jgi:serine/threonine protein kinase
VAKYPILSGSLTPSEAARRFVREIKLQASMQYHPNVHWPFNVMLLLGTPVAFFRRWQGDLSDLIEDPAVDDNARMAILIQVLAGLLHCRARGIVCHQDLKPENIFIRNLRDGFRCQSEDLPLTPLIADFGSVNLFREAGVFAGSRPYMAPEQWDESPLSEHTSVFAIGVMLHELISRGEHPIGEHGGSWHREEKPTFGRWQRNRHWRRWKEAGCPVVRPLVDSDLANIVARCLEPHPSDRPNLASLQCLLLEALRSRSTNAAGRVELNLTYWTSLARDPEWEFLNRRIDELEGAVLAHYGR